MIHEPTTVNIAYNPQIPPAPLEHPNTAVPVPDSISKPLQAIQQSTNVASAPKTVQTPPNKSLKSKTPTMSNEDKRRIKLDLRRSLDSPDSQFLMILLDPEAKKIRDLVKMIKQLFPGMEDSDEVKVYQGKYLLLPDVDIGVIKTQQDVIIIHCAKTKDVAVKKEYWEDFETMPQQNIKVQVKIASTQTDAASIKPTPLPKVKNASHLPLPAKSIPPPKVKITSCPTLRIRSIPLPQVNNPSHLSLPTKSIPLPQVMNSSHLPLPTKSIPPPQVKNASHLSLPPRSIPLPQVKNASHLPLPTKSIPLKIASRSPLPTKSIPSPQAKIGSSQTPVVVNQPVSLHLHLSQKVTSIESLGKNTVNIKDGKMIVHGPDQAVATAITRKVNSGEAKLGTLGGKKVLFYTGEKRSIQHEKGGPSNNNDAPSTAPSAKRLCTELKK